MSYVSPEVVRKADDTFSTFSEAAHHLCQKYIWAKCESPIEQIMGAALITAMLAPGLIGLVRCELFKVQYQIGPYRVDFMGIFGSDLRESYRVVIECDGADWHGGDKDQVIRDHERQAFVESKGYEFFRFSGKQIYADTLGCVCTIASRLDERHGVEERLSKLTLEERFGIAVAGQPGSLETTTNGVSR